MDSAYCLDASKRNIANARSYLNSGEAINRVPQEISGSMYWVMDAWLRRCDYDAQYGGYSVIRSKFIEVSPDHLRSKVMNCLAEATFLEYELEGGFEQMDSLLSMEEWKRRAYVCLDECEKTVCLMEDNMNTYEGKE